MVIETIIDLFLL